MKESGKVCFLFILLVSVFLLNIPIASSHALPVKSEPAANQVLEKSPTNVTIFFTERIDPKISYIYVFDSKGNRVDKRDYAVSPNDSKKFHVTLNDLAEDVYTVSWFVISRLDGHIANGAFVFSVGKEIPEEVKAAGSAVTASATIQDGLATWIDLLGQAILIGSLVTHLFVWEFIRKKLLSKAPESLLNSIRKRLDVLMLLGSGLIITGTSLFIVLQTLNLQNIQPTGLAVAVENYLQTTSGEFTYLRLSGALIAVAIISDIEGNLQTKRRLTAGLTTLILFILFTRVMVSHAAATDFYPTISVLINYVHLIFKDIWTGGLIYLSLVLLPEIRKMKQPVLYFSPAIIRFSILASLSIGLMATSGIYIIWLHLKDPANIFTTEWGQALIPMSAFIAILLLLRLYNQLFLNRKLIGDLSNKESTGSLINYDRFIKIEAAVGLAVLLTTAFLIITTPPPFPSEKNIFQQNVKADDLNIEVSIEPFQTQAKKIEIDIKDNSLKIPANIRTVSLALQQEEKDIGPILVEMKSEGEGKYVAEGSFFTIPGTWKLGIAVRRVNAYDAFGGLEIPLEEKPPFVDIKPKRKFGYFETLNLLAAVAAGIFSAWLYRKSKKEFKEVMEAVSKIPIETININTNGSNT